MSQDTLNLNVHNLIINRGKVIFYTDQEVYFVPGKETPPESGRFLVNGNIQYPVNIIKEKNSNKLFIIHQNDTLLYVLHQN